MNVMQLLRSEIDRDHEKENSLLEPRGRCRGRPNGAWESLCLKNFQKPDVLRFGVMNSFIMAAGYCLLEGECWRVSAG